MPPVTVQQQIAAHVLVTADATSGGVWDAASIDPAVRIEWVNELVVEVGEFLMDAVLSSAKYPGRRQFMNFSPALQYGEQIPAHIGPPGQVVCTGGVIGATYFPATERKGGVSAIERIKRSGLDRTSRQFYYFISDEGVLYFTGTFAKVLIATYAGIETVPPKWKHVVACGVLAEILNQGGGNIEAGGYYANRFDRYIALVREDKPLPPLKPYGAPKEAP